MKKNEGKKSKVIILRGEGANLHELEADVLKYDEKSKSLSEVHVGPGGLLKHVTPEGDIAEHHAIPMEEGTYHVGRQVEFNPFDQSIGQVFD